MCFLPCGLTLLRCMAVGHLDARVFLLCCKSLCCVCMSGAQAVLSTAEEHTRNVVGGGLAGLGMGDLDAMDSIAASFTS